MKGQMVTVNQEIDYDSAEEIALEFNCIDVYKRQQERRVLQKCLPKINRPQIGLFFCPKIKVCL